MQQTYTLFVKGINELLVYNTPITLDKKTEVADYQLTMIWHLEVLYG